MSSSSSSITVASLISSSVVAVVLGLLAVFAVREGFLYVPMTVEASREDMYEAIPANYQSSLPARSAPVQYNAVIRDQRLGSVHAERGAPFMAEPEVPLDNLVDGILDPVGAPIAESYVSPQQQGKLPQPPATANKDFDVYDKVRAVNQSRQMLFDRLVYSTGRSRRYGAGDPIRGDLPIVPVLPVADPNSPIMFRPPASIERDLRQGALQAIAGDNDVSRNLAQLKQAANPARRSYEMLPSGVVAQQKFSSVGGRGLSDLNVQSFY